MLNGIIVAVILLLWTVVAIRRAIVFVGEDMLESWQNGEDYDNELFAEAIRAGLISGIVWPFAAPLRALGSLLYRLAYKRADRVYQATGEAVPEPKPKHDITDELAKVTAEPITETRIQARLREQAVKGREEYQAQRLKDETAVGGIPTYKGAHADE